MGFGQSFVQQSSPSMPSTEPGLTASLQQWKGSYCSGKTVSVASLVEMLEQYLLLILFCLQLLLLLIASHPLLLYTQKIEGK